jgi:hypothetical protein
MKNYLFFKHASSSVAPRISMVRTHRSTGRHLTAFNCLNDQLTLSESCQVKLFNSQICPEPNVESNDISMKC